MKDDSGDRGRSVATPGHGHCVNQEETNDDTRGFVGTKQQRVVVEGESSSESRSDRADVEDHMAVCSVDLLPLWVVPGEDHNEDFAGVAGDNEDEQACDLEIETRVQGSRRETTFLDDRTGKVLDGTAVIRRGVWTEVPLQECFDSTGKKPVGARWVDIETADDTTRSRLVARHFKLRCGVDDLEGPHASMPPVELVKFLIVRAVQRSAVGDVRKVMWIDIGKAHLYAPVTYQAFVDLPEELHRDVYRGKFNFTSFMICAWLQAVGKKNTASLSKKRASNQVLQIHVRSSMLAEMSGLSYTVTILSSKEMKTTCTGCTRFSRNDTSRRFVLF